MSRLWGRGRIGFGVKFLLLCLGAIVVCLLPSAVWADFSTLPPPGTKPIALTTAQLEFKTVGLLVHAPVTLDGQEIFQIAALDAKHHADGEQAVSPLQTRVKLIENQLNYVIAQTRDLNALKTEVVFLSDTPLIEVSAGSVLTDLPLVSVTDLDGQIHGIPRDRWASELKEIIHNRLAQAIRERQPEYLQKQGAIAGGIFLGTSVLSGLLAWCQRRSKAQWLQQSMTPAAPPDSELRVSSSLDPHKLQQQRQRQRDAYRLQRYLLWVGQLLLWVFAISGIVGLFPQSRWAQTWILQEPILLLLIGAGSNLAIRAATVLIDRVLANPKTEQVTSNAVMQRQLARFTTYGSVFKGVVVVVVVVVAMLLALDSLQIPLAPVLAGAGILGFAVSFGSQTLIKDVINGVLILVEDQFVVGDFVDLGTVKGYVEDISLRVTKVRGAEGRLSTVPNSSISVVHNLTKDWSRAEISVEVAYNADIAQALDVMKDVAKAMHTDVVWQDRILDPVKLLGVTSIARTGVTLSIWIKTVPDAQGAIAREFRQRLKLALDAACIPVDVPQAVVVELSQPSVMNQQSAAISVQSNLE